MKKLLLIVVAALTMWVGVAQAQVATQANISMAGGGGGGGITGSGAAGQVTYWTGATTLGGAPGILVDPTPGTEMLQVGGGPLLTGPMTAIVPQAIWSIDAAGNFALLTLQGEGITIDSTGLGTGPITLQVGGTVGITVRASPVGEVTFGSGVTSAYFDPTLAGFFTGITDSTQISVSPTTLFALGTIFSFDATGNLDALSISGDDIFITNTTGPTTRFIDNAVQLASTGADSAVSPAATGRFRYSIATNTLQFSNNGAAYQSFMGATASLVAGRVTLSSGATTITDNANLTFNGTVLAVNQDGSAALPSITLGTAADPNTGIFHPAADEIAITSGGSERLRTRLTAAGTTQGRVEINAGTLASSAENGFVVNASLASTVGGYSVGAAIEATGFSGANNGQSYGLTAAIRANGVLYSGDGASYAGFFYNANGGKAGDGAGDWFNVKGIIGTAGFSVPDATNVNATSMGVVGVATASLNRNLGVIGRATGAGNTNVAVSGYATGGTQANVGALFAAEYSSALSLVGFGSAAVVASSESGTIPLFVGTNGAILSRVWQVEGNGTTRVGLDGSVGGPALTFGTIGTDPNTGIWHPAADTLAFSNNGVETMRMTSNNSVGIGTNAPTAQLHISGVPGTSNYHMYWVGALGATNAQVNGIRYELTSAGTAGSASRIGMQLLLSGTATGGGGTTFMYGTATDLGIACDSNNLRLSSTAVAPLGNVGEVTYAYGTSTGLNIGNFAEAVNGNLNIGVLAKSTTAKNSASNVGVLSVALNTGSSPVQVAGYFGLVNATPTLTSAALIADNGGTTSSIFEAWDNGTVTFTIADAGAVTATGTVLMSGVVTMSNSAVVSGRLNGASAAVVAANDLTLGATNLNLVSGNTQINALTITGWTAGAEVTLIFSGTPTVKHNTAGGGGTAVMLLAGSVDLVAAANTVLTLIYDGTSWQEKSRKVA